MSLFLETKNDMDIGAREGKKRSIQLKKRRATAISTLLQTIARKEISKETKMKWQVRPRGAFFARNERILTADHSWKISTYSSFDRHDGANLS